MKLEFQEYQVRKIVNVHKHVDGPWFWGKYTAHPYVGCRSGCEFCYLRGARYLGRRDPQTFDTLIQVKMNAIERLRLELPRLQPEIISVGDWQQPAEERYRLSRGMLEVVLENDFPLFIVERSPLLLRDLDLLVEINQKRWVGVLYSISNLDTQLKRAFEPRSPGIQRRLKAIEQLALAGIMAGVSMMPVLPLIGDQPSQIEELVRAARDHGAICVLAGGLTMDGVQAERTLAAARRFVPEVEQRWREFYRWDSSGSPAYGPPPTYNARLGKMVRELCVKYNLLDRLPRYIIPSALETNKRIAERLFLKTYDLELELANNYRIWAYRKAAWMVDELDTDIRALYHAQGLAGLRRLPGIGSSIASEIGHWLDNSNSPENQ